MEMSTKWNIGLVEDWNFGKPADTGHTLIATLRPLTPALSPFDGGEGGSQLMLGLRMFPPLPRRGGEGWGEGVVLLFSLWTKL